MLKQMRVWRLWLAVLLVGLALPEAAMADEPAVPELEVRTVVSTKDGEKAAGSGLGAGIRHVAADAPADLSAYLERRLPSGPLAMGA